MQKAMSFNDVAIVYVNRSAYINSLNSLLVMNQK